MSRGLLLAVALVTGMAVMMVELMAVRLMAPWFGQSQIVWTNVIGVVLAALAVGQWLGGRWSESRRGPGPAALLLMSGALALALPDIVAWVSPSLLPDDLGLGEAYGFVSLGSLLVAVLAVGLPMLAVGAVMPWLVRLSREVREVPGRVAGRLLGAGTLGSLLGTFAATHLFLARWGSAVTVRIAGVLLVVAGLVVWRRLGRNAGRGALAWLVVPLAAFLAAPGSPGSGVLASVESVYQVARVEELPDGTRLLRLNEGLDSFHSVWTPHPTGTGMYFDAFLLPALLAPPGDGAADVLVVGLAGGTMARQILAVAPELTVGGVELDEKIVALGREWFELPPEVDVLAGVDGRVALATGSGRHGAILVDAYAQQIYLPAHLCSREFFELVREKLVPGGVAALNVGGLSREDPVVASVAGTFATVFENTQIARIPGTRNMLVLGWNGEVPGSDRVRTALQDAGVAAVLPWMLEPGAFGPAIAPPDGPLRDGDAPVEALAHASWLGERVAVPAEAPPSGASAAELLALGAQRLRQTDWAAAELLLSALPEGATAQQRAQGRLRLGNIALERGQLDVAGAHYEAAREVLAEGGPAEDRAALDAVLTSNLELLEQRRARAALMQGALRSMVVLLIAVVAGAVLAGWWTTRIWPASPLPAADS